MDYPKTSNNGKRYTKEMYNPSWFGRLNITFYEVDNEVVEAVATLDGKEVHKFSSDGEEEFDYGEFLKTIIEQEFWTEITEDFIDATGLAVEVIEDETGDVIGVTEKATEKVLDFVNRVKQENSNVVITEE